MSAIVGLDRAIQVMNCYHLRNPDEVTIRVPLGIVLCRCMNSGCASYRLSIDRPRSARPRSPSLVIPRIEPKYRHLFHAKGDPSMELEPLQEWICEGCGQKIESANEGILEWCNEPAKGGNHPKRYGFKIVHGDLLDPSTGREISCSHYKGHGSPPHSYSALASFVGDLGLNYLLGLLDPGRHHDPDYSGPEVKDLREWTELVRRLHVPYYEEARRYWDRALEEGRFESMGEVSIYEAEFLQNIIAEYEGD